MQSTIAILILFCWLPEERSARFCNNTGVIRAPGDIIIGGIFPIHRILDIVNRTVPGPLKCSGFEISTFLLVQAMVHSIEQVNNSTLLPGVKLGYEIYDSCADVAPAVEATMKFISKFNSLDKSIEIHCNYTDYVPAAKAIVGDLFSEISIVIARILNFYLIPQMSYVSSAEDLSDKTKFASFFRAVPSDKHQISAIIKLLQHLKWNWIGILATDDDYGRSAMNSLISQAEEQRICIDFHFRIPVQNKKDQNNFIKSAAHKIMKSSAEVMVAFIRSSDIQTLFEILINYQVNKTWIASDAWSNSKKVASNIQAEQVGTILGFTFKNGTIPNFNEYLKKLVTHTTKSDDFTEEFFRHLKNDVPSSQSNKSYQYSKITENINDAYNYCVYLTIKAITHALQKVLNCDHQKCNGNFDFAPWQLLSEMKKVRFPTEDGFFHFDSSGDYSSGYDLIHWETVNNSTEFITVGNYSAETQSITLHPYFNKTAKIGVFRCSDTCKPGERKTVSPENNCCYSCSKCTEGTYSDKNDSSDCKTCQEDEWSNKGSSRCQKRTVDFLKWSEGLSIVLIIFAILGVLIICVVSIMFTRYLSTPAVKAAGGWMCYIMLLSLVICLVSSIFFIGKPTDLICKIRQPLFSICFTLSVSCILVKSFRIILAFSFNPIVRKNLRLLYKPFPVIITATGVQVIICSLWLSLVPPKTIKNRSDPKTILFQCSEGSRTAFGIMLGYIAFLACICFILAFKGRKAPKMYNEARFITFSMLVYLILWISFGVIYLNLGESKYIGIIESIAILASVYSFLCCHFFPTCYVVLFKKESNVESNYLTQAREHFKQKGQFVCPVAKMRRISQISNEEQTCNPTVVKASIERECLSNQKTGHNYLNTNFQNHRVSHCLRKRHKSC
ncbi:G-protein coupled receptor family C group 6 member A-like [Hypanus sabinus]|uniref:G-protein coupled receptor family C group 6 member A-like n=1 Tax=Hypanus sabinus TaxID=79690 RepID=UPI0028C4FDCD|nr:G-protein coupled receptor family C group 6 member A-like [Hypanus sabinus]